MALVADGADTQKRNDFKIEKMKRKLSQFELQVGCGWQLPWFEINALCLAAVDKC